MPARREQEQPRDRITQAGRIVGLGGIVLSSVFYGVTYFTTGHGEASSILVGAFLTLWGFTEGAGALKQLKGGDK